jgi:ribonuclease M5
MEKLRVKYPVVVEGRYDKAKLSSIMEGDIIQTDGFRVFADKKKLDLIRRLAGEGKVILLTDSDRAGFRIRSHIAGAIPPERVIHVYIPQVPGKERRKVRPSAEGTLGVEGMDPEILRRALEQAGALEEGEETPPRDPITKGDLYALGLSGGPGSAGLRRSVQKRLGLPAGVGPNALPGILTRITTREELRALVEELRNESSQKTEEK